MNDSASSNTMSKQQNGVALRISGTNAGVPSDDRTVQARQRRLLCSSELTDDQRAEAEPNVSRPHKNSACNTGRRTTPKWRIGGAVKRDARYRQAFKRHQLQQAQMRYLQSRA